MSDEPLRGGNSSFYPQPLSGAYGNSFVPNNRSSFHSTPGSYSNVSVHASGSQSNDFSTPRLRACTQVYLGTPQNQFLNFVGEQSRTRSSSCPRPPTGLPEESPIVLKHVQRTRSGNRIPTAGNRNSITDSPSGRKKRKRLNPQRRSFYKALHSDFPSIAEALREARQGTNVVCSLREREIFFSTIEARPPQDPTNLNVRRYNDMVFIWDPAMETWLQVPGNGKAPDFESPDGFPIYNEGNVGPDFPLQLSSISGSRRSQELPHFQFLSEDANFAYEGSFASESSTSEDEDYYNSKYRERSSSFNDFLPTNLLDDVL